MGSAGYAVETSRKRRGDGDEQDTAKRPKEREGNGGGGDGGGDECGDGDMEGLLASLEPEASAPEASEPGAAEAMLGAEAEAEAEAAATAAATAAAVAVAAVAPVLPVPTTRDRRMFGALLGHLAAGKKDAERTNARLETRKKARPMQRVHPKDATCVPQSS